MDFKITEGTLPPTQPPTSRTWAHDSIGVTAPADTWYLAEGCTAGDFETWVLVQNPNDSETQVTLTYMTPHGVGTDKPNTLVANSRVSINVAWRRRPSPRCR